MDRGKEFTSGVERAEEEDALPAERPLRNDIFTWRRQNCASEVNSVAVCGLCGILDTAHNGTIRRCICLAEVRVQEGEPLENALRRFKRKVQTEDIIKEVKRHSFYLKPGEKKRVKEALARKRNRKKVRKEQD
jgi:small subunit ribosomal protein S21